MEVILKRYMLGVSVESKQSKERFRYVFDTQRHISSSLNRVTDNV